MGRTRTFNSYLSESLQDQREARAYLNVALEELARDGDQDAFLLALRDVAEARGGLSGVAGKTKLNRQNLYRALSEEGNPRLTTLNGILNSLGLRLSIEKMT